MAEVFLGLGSNIHASHNIASALQLLTRLFDVRLVSSLYKSDAVGFVADPFLNCVVQLHTELNVRKLQQQLREVELQHGALQGAPKFSSRSLDIDILLYDQCIGVIDGVTLPREEIIINAFVLWPMAEIAPLYFHPILQQNYQSLWSKFDKQTQVIERLDAVAGR